MALMGLDIGTTGCKCAVFAENGQRLSYQYQEYTRDIGSTELDGEIIWKYFSEMIPVSIKMSHQEVTAIAVTSCGEAIASIGQDGRPLSRFFQSIDPRGIPYMDAFSQETKERIRAVTGIQPLPRYSLSKIAYLRAERPEIFRKTWKYMMLEDYIIFCLTGQAVTDYTIATRTAAFNLFTKDFDEEILAEVGVEKSRMCRCVPVGSVVGCVRKEVANLVGLTEKTVVVTGGHDSVPEALCSGLLSEGIACLGCGTSEGLTVLVPEHTNLGADMLRNNFNREPYPLTQYHLSFGVNANSGNLIKWFRDVLGTDALKEGDMTGENPYQILERMIPLEPTGLLAIPHFIGSSTPDFVKEARGTIAGMKLSTTRGDIYKALMEGAGYELAYIADRFRTCGVEIQEIRASGGGAKSQVQLQVKTDILGVPLIPMQTKDTTVTGCAMMAGTASGIYKSYQEAARLYVKLSEPILPDAERNCRYQELYLNYVELRSTMMELWLHWAEKRRCDCGK